MMPPDALLLSDEISYIRRRGDGFHAWGTPFSGDLGAPGHNLSAPLAAVYLLVKAESNQVRALKPGAAIEGLLRNTLFFARETSLQGALLATVCELIAKIPVHELAFKPDPAVWDEIG
jgi:hypothetical protein